jgi:S-adenosylmethionine:tRNA ribosyltransferase-isomerase
MIAADRPIQRPAGARLLVVDGTGRMAHAPRSAFVDFLRPGDLVIANDAATLPASLHGVHARTGAEIEVRLAGHAYGNLPPEGGSHQSRGGSHQWRIDGIGASPAAADWIRDVREFVAVVFGAGDFRIRTEDRPLPPSLISGDRLALGPLSAVVLAVLGHPRLVALRFEGSPDEIRAGLARHGRPVQYAHLPMALALWDVWTPVAGLPVAFEPPSASFALDWQSVHAMRDRGIGFATVTHAAGISSTGDSELDRRLPFDEPYRIPETTARAIRQARARGKRIVAVGTTVVRALEAAAGRDGIVAAGEGVATGRIGPATRLRVVDALLSGTHEPGSSHYDLLRAFADAATLERATGALEARGYRTHEFGDSVLLEKTIACPLLRAPRAPSRRTVGPEAPGPNRDATRGRCSRQPPAASARETGPQAGA